MKRFVTALAFVSVALAFVAPERVRAQISVGGSEADQYLYFFNSGNVYGESLKWDEANDKFTLTDDLSVDGSMSATFDLIGDRVFGGQVHVGNASELPYVNFWAHGSINGESLDWWEAQDRFRFSDDVEMAELWTSGPLRVNRLGAGTTAEIHFYDSGGSFGSSLTWSGSADKFTLGNDLEISGALSSTSSFTSSDLRSNGHLYVNFDGPDADASIHFYEGGLSNNETFMWDDGDDRFWLSDALTVADNLVAGTNTSVSYNAFGGTSPQSGDISIASDLYVASDLEVGEVLYLSGALMMKGFNSTGHDTDQYIYFYEDNSRNGEHLRWDNGSDRFELSDDLLVNGSVASTTLDLTGNALHLSSDGPDGDSFLYFYDASSKTGEFLKWNDGQDAFHLSNKLWVERGNLVVGWDATTFPSYNAFGDDDPASGDMTNESDAYVEGDLEVGDVAYLSKKLYMEGSNSTGADGDQNIYFYEDNSRTGESLRWDDSADRFELSDDLDFNVGSGDATVRNSVGNDVDLVARQDFEIMIDNGNDGTVDWWRLYHDGIFANAQLLAEFQEDGDLRIRGTLTQNTSFDLAESFVRSEPVEAGDVVRVEPGRSDAIRRATAGDGGAVLGVVSLDPGVVLGGPGFDPADLERVWGADVRARFEAERAGLVAEVLAETPWPLPDGAELDDSGLQKAESLALERFYERHFAPVALAGRVPVKADASADSIAVGDYLTAGPVPGVAVKATASGPVIGTALEPLLGGQGQILVFVDRGWYGGAGTGEAAATDEPSEAAGDDAGSTPARVLLTTNDVGPREFTIARDGGAGPAAELLRVDAEGNLYVKGSIRGEGHSLAEYRPAVESFEPGDLVVVDRAHSGAVRPGDRIADPAVVGIVSGSPGVSLGNRIAEIAHLVPEMAEELNRALATSNRGAEAEVWRRMRAAFDAVYAPVAMSGIVSAKVDASYGAVDVGDLLVTSPTRGHAMKSKAGTAGTVVAKALERLTEGQGRIEVLVMLR